MTHQAASLPLRRLLGARLLAGWLLLAAILGHAVLPIASPLQPASGSAFSAGTLEVTTRPDRKRRPETAVAARSDKNVVQLSGDGISLPAQPRLSHVLRPEPAADLSWPGAAPPVLDRVHSPSRPAPHLSPDLASRPRRVRGFSGAQGSGRALLDREKGTWKRP